MKDEGKSATVEACRKNCSRSDFLRAGLGAVFVAGTLGATLVENAKADDPYTAEVVDALNFLYQLKVITEEYYDQARNIPGLIPDTDRSTFDLIRTHENGHSNLLGGLLGNRAVAPAPVNYAARFNVFANYADFLLVAQGIEDACTGGILGLLPVLGGYPDTMTSILQIRSADARHSSKIRLLRGKSPWISPADLGEAVLSPLYSGENSLVQGGIGLPDSAVSFEAFDEPLGRATVQAFFQSVFG